MQGISYAGARRGCEHNQVTVRQPKAEHLKEEAVAPGRLEGQREQEGYQIPGVRGTW